MTEVLGRGEEGYRWGHKWEDMPSRKGERFNISNWSTTFMLQILNYTPLSYSHLCAKRYTCRGAKCSYPGFNLFSKPCTYLGCPERTLFFSNSHSLLF